GPRIGGDDRTPGHRARVGGKHLRPDHHRPLCQRLGATGTGMVPELSRPVVTQSGDHQPAADSRLGRGAPAVLPYRACQGQPVERKGDGRRAIHRTGDARRIDGPGVLQRHPATAALMPQRGRTAAPKPEVMMTRLPPRRLLALALASAATAAAPTVFAQAANPFAMPASPGPVVAVPADPQAFTVSDIRIDGLQRVPAGTVFTYLPVERGDLVGRGRVAEAIRALYGTGFFDDVRASRQGDILVLTVVERPAINKLTLVGNKDIKTEDLLKGLADIGLAEGDTFNRMSLDKVVQELTR